MRVTDDVAVFAVVGAVNHGKSSVVAALAEDDDVRISSMPGETVANQRFSLRELLVFFDTPGFQNARKALAEIDAMPSGDDPLERFRRFVERHRTNTGATAGFDARSDARSSAEFEAECRLLQPIVDGAGIVYVVDGSQPVREINLCEMEVLRLTGAPRLAVVNRTGRDDFSDAWKGRLSQHFNLVREFDAHHVTYADRKDLVESLAGIERRWKDRMRDAVAAMEADRVERIADCASLIAEFVTGCLQHAERARVDPTIDDAAREKLVERLRQRYMTAIAAREHDVHRKIIVRYAHRHVAPDTMPADLFADGLFADETWRLFGLGMRQLIGLSTVAGGIAGAGVDAVTLGHSFGLGAALGAVVGAGGAYALGRKRPDLSIDWPTASLPGGVRSMLPGKALRFGGGDVVVGPFKAENFPWILVDRALCVFAYVHTRSHARRDHGIANIQTLLPLLDRLRLTVAHWTDAARAACQPVFKSLRAGRRPSFVQVAGLRAAIADALGRVAAAERSIVDGDENRDRDRGG